MTQTQTATIVNLNTSVTAAAQPSQLQKSGAVVSAGGTTLSAGATQYIGNSSQLASYLPAPLALESLSWVTGVVTATIASGALDLAIGDTFTVEIAGASPAGYNGTFTATVTSTTTFTYPIAANPGTETAPGTYTAPEVAFLIDANTTFWAQGSAVGYYVLELGPQASNAAAIAALQTWITNNDNPQQFYAYLVPGAWDANQSSALKTLAANYSSAQGMRYFFVTTTQANLAVYAGVKSVFAVVPSPTQAVAEHQAAAFFYQWLVNNPGPANILAPMSYRFLSGITQWTQKGNGSAITAILTAFGNIALQGAEGGITSVCAYKGTTMDGAQAASWYGVDWVQINAKQDLAAAILNGSNQQPPLLYDQNGINSLQAVAQRVASNAVSYGCAASATVSAVPFATYIAANPNDYANGVYNGLSCTMTSQKGFLSITFNLSAVQF